MPEWPDIFSSARLQGKSQEALAFPQTEWFLPTAYDLLSSLLPLGEQQLWEQLGLETANVLNEGLHHNKPASL